MGSWFYEGKYSVQFTVDDVTKDSWEDFKMIPEKKPVMQAPDLGLRLFKRFEFSVNYIIEDNDEVDNIIDDIIDYLHGKTGSIAVGENTYTALFNVVDISAEDHYTTFRLQAILSDFDPEDPNSTLDFGDFNTWTDWHLIPDETLKIVPPQLKEKYVDIPGRNGAIDLCNAVVGLPRFERMTGSLSFTIYDNDPDAIYNDMLDNLHGHKFDEVEIMGKSYDGRWVIESYEPDGEEPKITLGYNLILHDWTFNEEGGGGGKLPRGLKSVDFVICGDDNRSATSGFSLGSLQSGDVIEFTTAPIGLSSTQYFAGSDGNWAMGFGAVDSGAAYNVPSKWKNVTISQDTDTSACDNNEKRTYKFSPTGSYSTLFGYYRNGQYGYFGKIYGCKITRNNNLIYDFVPAYNENTGTYGLYDKVNIYYRTSTANTAFRIPSDFGDGIYFLLANTSTTTDAVVEIAGTQYIVDHIGKEITVQTAGENDNNFVDVTWTATGYKPVYVKVTAGMDITEIACTVVSGSASVAAKRFSKPTIVDGIITKTGAENMFLLTTANENIVNDQGRTWYKTNDGKMLGGMAGWANAASTGNAYICRFAIARTDAAADISGPGGQDGFVAHIMYKNKDYFVRRHSQYSFSQGKPPSFQNDYGHAWWGADNSYTAYTMLQLAEMAEINLEIES